MIINIYDSDNDYQVFLFGLSYGTSYQYHG